MKWFGYVVIFAVAWMMMLFLSHVRAALSQGKAKRVIEKARREGRVVESVYSHYFGHGGDDFSMRGDQRGCVYRYEYQGQEYKVKLFMRPPVPDTLELIIYNNPKKAKKLESAADPSAAWKVVVYIICLFISYLFLGSIFFG